MLLMVCDAVTGVTVVFISFTGRVLAVRWSVARQLLVLQLAVVLAVVLGFSVLTAVDERRDSDEATRQRVLGVAVTLADAPSTVAALLGPDPTGDLQPLTVRLRQDTGVEFITVMAPDRTRYTHTNPELIGGQFLGTIEPALRGQVLTEVYPGTLGPSIRAVAPVRGPGGEVVGLVAAGVTQRTVAELWRRQLPLIAAATAGALAVAVAVAVLLSRRVRRQTHGLAPAELRAMVEHHEAVLHSISEGLVVVDGDTVAVVNDEARRLLDLPDGPVTPADLPEFLRDPDPDVRDEVHVTDQRVLVVNHAPVLWEGRRLGVAVTLRDRTELQGALGELDSMRVFAESLRAQAHESANRLHTVVTLVEMGQAGEAVRFATEELALSQQLVDRLTAAVGEPALVALLLGKTAQAAERGVELTVTEDTALPGSVPLSARELVTVVGNLVDNALDACVAAGEEPWVEVTVAMTGEGLEIRVADSGPGMDTAAFERAQRRGYSTKSDQRGLGLALVAQIVRRHGGRLRAEVTYGSVVSVTVPVAAP